MDFSDPPSRPGPVLEPPATPPARGHPLALLAVMVGVYIGPGIVAQVSSPVVGLAWTQLFAFLLPAAAIAAASNLVPARALRIDRPAPRWTVLVGLALGATGLVAAGAIMALVSTVLPRSVVERFDVAAELFKGPRSLRIAVALVAGAVAPFCEEIAFRGHLLSVLGARLRPAAAIGVSALLFAVMHVDPVRFVAVLALGLLYGWLAWRAGSVWPSIAAHLANNSIASAVAVGMTAPNLAEARQRPVDLLQSLAIGLALVVPLLLLYRRLTPEPPPFETALAPADPTDRDPRLRLRRVPGWMLVVAVIGIAFVVLLATLRRVGLR